MRLRVVVNGQLHRLHLPPGSTAADVVKTLTGHWREGRGPAAEHALFTPGGLEIPADHPLDAHAAGDDISGELIVRPRFIH